MGGFRLHGVTGFLLFSFHAKYPRHCSCKFQTFPHHSQPLQPQLYSKHEKSSKNFLQLYLNQKKFFIGRTSKVEHKMWKILFQLLFASFSSKNTLWEINNFLLSNRETEGGRKYKRWQKVLAQCWLQSFSLISPPPSDIGLKSGFSWVMFEMMENSYNKCVCGLVPPKIVAQTPTEHFTVQWFERFLKNPLEHNERWKLV